MQTVNYRKGLPAMAVCFLFWGFQPLYWYLCTCLWRCCSSPSAAWDPTAWAA